MPEMYAESEVLEYLARTMPLSADADRLIQRCITYTDCTIAWNEEDQAYAAFFTEGRQYVLISDMDWYLRSSHDALIKDIVLHIHREAMQAKFTSHGNRSSYVQGCRGLLCRRAHREGQRTFQKATRSPKYAVADSMLDEAEQHFLSLTDTVTPAPALRCKK